jgi:phosphoribosylglycinamide formyltransferase-1
MSATPARLAILLSGRGSNFLAIADAISSGKLHGAEIAVVISSKADAPGLAAARSRGLPAFAVEARGRTREEQDVEIMVRLRSYQVDLVCLAGFMRVISPEFVQAYPDRILNIHPSLLPAFPGLDAQRQAFEHGVQVAGCTVHFVDEELDHGVIVMQRAVPVQEGEDAQKLADRILAAEHDLYPEAIRRVLSGNYKIQGRRYVYQAPPNQQSTRELLRNWLKMEWLR